MKVLNAAGFALVLMLGVLLLLLVNFRTIRKRNTERSHFDALIVLGSPANPDGSVSPEERTRVTEAVHEFRAGVAPRMILSGGPAHNAFVEADVMARLAEIEGVPPSAVIEEPRAQNTIQNIFYSDQILRAHGWSSAEVVSSPSHLPRTALILEHYGFSWRLDAAQWPAEFLRGRIWAIYWYEALECLRLRVLGFPASPFLPVRAQRQQE